MKTWEMIKELTENPEKKFRLKIEGEESTVQIDNFNQDGKIDLDQVEFLSIHDEWEEVKKPVTWDQAFKAGLDGKNIKPNGQHLTYPDYRDLHYAIQYIAKRPAYYKKIMLDEWYIED